MPLTANACLTLCDWVPSPPARDGGADRPAQVVCRGCGTQWRLGLGWTPRQADASVPAEVRRLLNDAAAAGSAGS